MFPKLTLIENLVVAVQQPLARDGPQADQRRLIWTRPNELLERLRTVVARPRRASELSFGQRKLLEFATVLMGVPGSCCSTSPPPASTRS